jgi:hypothetical protein
MACDLTTIQAAACLSGIGKEQSKIKLLQLIAQLTCEAGDGTSSAVWGEITGTLSNQTDLQAALDALEMDIALAYEKPINAAFEREEFLGGAGTGAIAGSHGWGTNSVALSNQAAIENAHPGTVDVASGATATNFGTYQLIGSPSLGTGVVQWGAITNWRHRFVFKSLSTTAIFVYVGLVVNNVATTATTPTGLFLRFNSAANANFRFVAFNGATETDLDSGVVGDTEWHTLIISSTTIGQIIFQLDSGAPQTIGTNVTGTALRVAFQIGTGENVAKTVRCDLWDFLMTGLAR